jgi:hypothetical protein
MQKSPPEADPPLAEKIKMTRQNSKFEADVYLSKISLYN